MAPAFTIREFLVLNRLKTKSGNPEGFRVPNHISRSLLRVLFTASARRGVLVNGSADHDLEEYHPGVPENYICSVCPEVHTDRKQS